MPWERIKMKISKVCTVNLIVRKLETSVMEITPNIVTMESETVLTQYLITNWTELQKRANRANQLVLFFLAGANFWEKHAKNCAIMSLFWC